MKVLIRLVLLAAALTLTGSALAQNPQDLLKQIDSLQRPKWDDSKRNDPIFMKDYSSQLSAYTQKRNDLILQLYRIAPEAPKTAELMILRWREFQAGTLFGPTYRRDLFKDIDDIMATNPPTAIREAGLFTKAAEVLESGLPDLDPTPFIDTFIRAFPQSPKGAMLLLQGATTNNLASHREEYLDRIIKDFPDSEYAPMALGALRQTDALGKPFSLRFSDALTGDEIDIARYTGKVVILDFWATWCGPCVAAMPHLKELYGRLHNQGLEVVGVSLDAPEAQNGLVKLKDFVSANQIPWPQYYQGKGWDSEFSKSWGILMIPTTFVIDKAGNLALISPKDLDAAVERLLKS